MGRPLFYLVMIRIMKLNYGHSSNVWVMQRVGFFVDYYIMRFAVCSQLAYYSKIHDVVPVGLLGGTTSGVSWDFLPRCS